MALHVTNGDAVVPALAAAAGIAPAEVVVWREILHDGPVPEGLGADALARLRARHIAARGWSDAALEDMRERDARLAAFPPGDEVVLWFETDLFDRLLQAQVEDRLAGRPGPVTRVRLPHPPRGDLRAALDAREPVEPDPGPFAALRSPDPRAWVGVDGFERLLEELPDLRTGLGRTERAILEALAAGPLAPGELFVAVAAREHPPWLGDTAVFALASDLDSWPTRTTATRSRPTGTPSSPATPPARRSTAGSEASTSARAAPTGRGIPPPAARCASTSLATSNSSASPSTRPNPGSRTP